jgi:DEAD/DEAH box helicase domain-containing protein
VLPTVVTTQLQATLRDYLRTTFSLRDRAYERALLDYLADPEHGLFRGPYLDLRLPFRRAPAASAPLEICPAFDPYAHQLRAWERLASADTRPRSTLVATGTGSGKTECFLFPLLDHCWRHRGEPGIKAIILYPMNALASDQAARIAREIQWLAPFRGSSPARPDPRRPLRRRRRHPRSPTSTTSRTCGSTSASARPTSCSPITGCSTSCSSAPRTAPSGTRTASDTLQYLVLDELHTYDGAQGTDVAFLLRRLKQRLRVPAGHLCCVGTSATIGAEASPLLHFAAEIFGEPFEDDAVITEDRLSVAETLALASPAKSPTPESPTPESPTPESPTPESPTPESPTPDPLAAPAAALDANTYPGPRAFLEAQAQLWLGQPPAPRHAWIAANPSDPHAPDLTDEAGRVLLGERLYRHPFLHHLLAAQAARGAGPHAWDELVASINEPDLQARPRDEQWLVLASFLALVAYARRNEGARVVPFLALQVQLWLRELRRLLRKIPRAPDDPPQFAWGDAIGDDGAPHAVQVYCRECGDIGLGLLQLEGKRELIRVPERVGEAYLRRADTARYIRLGHHLGEASQGRLLRHYLCPQTLHLSLEPTPVAYDIDADGERTPIPPLPVDVHGDLSDEGRKFLGRCPACGDDDGLTILGSRAASLSSVAISHLFLSPYNSDRKLLAFTDSVQDASHRAGFFASRTFRFVLRTAIQATLEAQDADLPLAGFVDALLEYWRARLEGPGKGDPARLGRLAATLLPPDLRDDPDYRAFIEAAADPDRRPSAKQRRELDKLLRLRLSWEVARELGLGIVIGRSLDRTACATATPDPAALQTAAAALHAWLHETRPLALRGAGPSLPELTHYLEGLVERLRARGGVHDPLLDAYVRSGAKFMLSRRKNPRISRFGPNTRYPLFAFHGASHPLFEPLLAPPSRATWYRDWTARALRVEPRDGGIGEVLSQALRRLARAGLVDTRPTKGPAKTDPQASGLDPAKLWLTRQVALVGCATCGTTRTIAAAALPRWQGARCLTYRCAGTYQATALEDEHGYYRRIFKAGRIHRVFAAEHTGLLDRHDRETLEDEFKRGHRPDAPNLLTCTPTLEMGIDIGDLSAVMLCSVPPLPANYVQRVGRAGRSTGNALVLTIANARPHDRYFFELPEQMMRGQIDPPACFLDAPDMLARQLVAHALDAWAREGAAGQKIPRKMGDLLGPANKDGFPHAFFRFYAERKAAITRDFFAAFGRDPALHPGWAEIHESLTALVETDHVITRIRAAFAGVEAEREELRRRRDALTRRRDELLADPGKAHPHDHEPDKSAEHELADIDQAKHAYGAQLVALSEKYPLAVLTDAGVLPNYAFPEPGVTLRATLLGPTAPQLVDPEPGKTNTNPAKEAKRRPRERAEYIRPASAAIKEFAPFNSFYAEGRRIKITQLDLGSPKAPTVESWRFCAACNHSERQLPDAAPAKECPRCGHRDWSDQGQLRRLIEFRKAWSTTTLLEASTADDSDERDQERYPLVELIEVEEGSQRGEARLIDEGEVVFGYELLPRALLREINFGREHDVGAATTIAGESIAQAGFRVCTHCGRVQDRHDSPARPEHLPWCRTRTAGAAEDFVDVGLYRHNTSEAIRILLPVADHEVGKIVSSFRAALELGFRRKFGGQPAHLRVSTMSEPAGAARQRFLVIYDTVPGGTGYLAELWRQGQLFTVMELALDAMKRCRCATQPGQGGCYRCLYAHQHQRELTEISRARAVDLFESILARRAAIRTIPSLTEVNLDSLLESELERRFVSALRRAAEARGWRWTETAIGGRQGFRIVVADDLAWEIRPQVALGPGDGVAHRTRPDFLLVPVGRRTRRIAIYTDGFEFHAQPAHQRARLADDLTKRRAILATSDSAPPHERFWVWSLTWTDISAALSDSGAAALDPLLAPIDTRTFAHFAPQLATRSPDAKLASAESFALLLRYLGDPDDHATRNHILTCAIAALDLRAPVRAPAVEALRDALAAGTHRPPPQALIPEKNGTIFAALRQRPFLALLLSIPHKDLARRDFGVRAQLRLYDLHEDRAADGFEPAWRAFLQAWNLLQFIDADIESSEHLLTTDEHPAAPLLPDLDPGPAPAPLRADLLALSHSFPEFAPLLRRLDAAGLPAPLEPEDDLQLAGVRVDVDLLWPAARVALLVSLTDQERRRFIAAGWLAFDPVADDPAAITDALTPRITP